MFSQVTLLTLLAALIGCDAAAIQKRNLPANLPMGKALQDQTSGFCLTDYADDGQLYSAAGIEPNLFTLSPALTLTSPDTYILTDDTLNKFCVGSQGGGIANQFQCSGDADSIDGGGQEFGYRNVGELLLYNNDADFFACGDETTGVNYFVGGSGDTMERVVRLFTGGSSDEGNCRTVNLKFIDADGCGTLSTLPILR